jgi:hypothetical protein
MDLIRKIVIWVGVVLPGISHCADLGVSTQIHLCLSIVVAGAPVSTFQSLRITRGNIDDLFAHQYRDGSFGCKAVAYRDSEGNIGVRFWRTGSRQKAIPVRHANVVAEFLAADANSLLGKAKIIEKYATQLAEEARRFPRLTPERLSLNRQSIKHFETARTLRAAAEARWTWRLEVLNENYAGLMREMASNVLGFQFTAVPSPITGQLQITDFDISSRLTPSQIREYFQTPAQGSKGAELADLIIAVHNSIDPDVSGYERRIWVEELGRTSFPDGEEFNARLKNAGLEPK